MKKIIIILLLILSTSCSKKNKMESMFITNKNEYWEYTSYCFDNCCVYFQFHENDSYNKYLRSYVGFDLFNNDGDIISDSRSWSIKNDSTFVWDKQDYYIEKMVKNEILLYYFDQKIKNKKCYVRLSKWVDTSKGPKHLDAQNDVVKK